MQQNDNNPNKKNTSNGKPEVPAARKLIRWI